MKYLIFISLAFVFLSCKQNQPKTLTQIDTIKKFSNPVKDSIIYEFINFLANDKNEKNFVLRGDKVLDYPNLNYDEFLDDSLLNDPIFSKDDIVYIKEQMKGVKEFSINPKLFFGKEIISRDTLEKFRAGPEGRWTFWENYKKKYGESGYCIILLPLFSKDNQKVRVQTSYSCGGTCGQGGIFVYQKIKGKWQKIKEESWWIN